MNFDVKVVTREAISAVGMKIRTNMERAMQDCSKLWHDDFAPRMAELAPGESESYGISWALDETNFEYAAALPFPEAQPTPAGMERFHVPGGLYAECSIASLEELTPAYTYIFADWLPRHPEYTTSMTAPGYELYPADHMRHGRLTVCFPLREAFQS